MKGVAVKGATFWQRLVDVVRAVLGLPVARTDALAPVFEMGAVLMTEGPGDSLKLAGNLAQTASKPFRAWFRGLGAALARHLGETVLAAVSGAQFGPGFDAEPVSMPDLRKAARAKADASLVKTYTNVRSNITLAVRRSGIEQAVSHGGAAFTSTPGLGRTRTEDRSMTTY